MLFTEVKGRCRVTTRENAVLWDSAKDKRAGGPRLLGVKKEEWLSGPGDRLCEDLPCGNGMFGGAHSSCVREMCQKSEGACPVFHLSPHSEAPSLAKLQGRSCSEAVSKL